MIIEKNFFWIWRWLNLVLSIALISVPWFVPVVKQHAPELCILGIVWLVIRAFWHSFDQYDELNQKIKSKLLPRYDVNIRGCKILSDPKNEELFRLRVSNTGISAIKGCKGLLSEIFFEGDPEPVWSGANIELVFAQQEDSDANNKTIFNGTFEFLDVLAIEHENGRTRSAIYFGTKNREWKSYRPKTDEILARDGVYYFHINVVSIEGYSAPIQLKFTLSKARGESMAQEI